MPIYLASSGGGRRLAVEGEQHRRFLCAGPRGRRNEDGSWRRDDERHENVLVGASGFAGLLRAHGVAATVAASFGTERLPSGLVALSRHRLA